MRSMFASVFLVAFATLIGCSPAPKTEAKRDDRLSDAAATLERFYDTDPTARDFLNAAHAYAVFPKVGKGGAVAGGAYGQGVLYQNGRPVGYCDMTQATVGAQLGGQTYRELIVFETQAALNRFKSDNFAMSANASAVALKAGAAKAARYEDGVVVFVDTDKGLMGEVSVGGQKFNYVSDADAPAPKNP